jgi:protein SCO1/2
MISLLGIVLALAPHALSHSLDEVDAMLNAQEKYFQPIDRPAPDFTLQTADGKTVRLADLRGDVVVLTFIYTSCPDVCPLHTERIAELQGMINVTPMKDRVEFVTITTDPTRDTPDVMRAYAQAHGLDLANWLFLRTTADQAEDATRKLAEAFGHRFDKAADGVQMHGVITHIIDQDGRWRANFHGLEFQPVNLVTFVNALTNKAQKPHPHAQKRWWSWLQGE